MNKQQIIDRRARQGVASDQLHRGLDAKQIEGTVVSGRELSREDGLWTLYSEDGEPLFTFAQDMSRDQAVERAEWWLDGYDKGLEVGRVIGRIDKQDEIKRALGLQEGGAG